MTNMLALVFAALPLVGCAAVSSSPGSSSGSQVTQNDSMSSLPPAPQSESVPQLEEGQVWVPGYYEPIAGAWMWHKGRVTAEKVGYRMVPASYRQEGARVVFTPPRWRRADLATN
jgi:hypothetical protein